MQQIVFLKESVLLIGNSDLSEYSLLNVRGMDAVIVDAVVVGSRCRGLEREDTLFDAFNADGLHIGGVRVDINPITAQRTGTLESYLPQAEAYLDELRGEREREAAQLVAELPDMEIDGVMTEEMEARVWELRLPKLDEAGRLAVEIDRFSYAYDASHYHDSSRNMTENVLEIKDALGLTTC